MSRRIRIFMGIVLLAISISLLVWGFAPTRREIRTQPISPNELQLPFLLDISLLYSPEFKL
ncbi:MAG: hypothetical protein AB1607_05090 [Chloroflexota bacterium]